MSPNWLVKRNTLTPILTYVKELVGASKGHWIGLKLFNKTNPAWLDSASPPSYFKWNPGEPNGDAQSCATIGDRQAVNGKWMDESCTIDLPSICEKPADCASYSYGENCTRFCSPNCGGKDQACDSNTGKCTSGCAYGFSGDRCNVVEPVREGDASYPGLAIFALVAFAFVMVIFVAGAIVLTSMKKDDSEGQGLGDSQKEKKGDERADDLKTKEEEDEEEEEEDDESSDEGSDESDNRDSDDENVERESGDVV
ncbi:lymphocyte antigen 75 [Elysia marginata]|uniref:Lymphocyte antigen 75 n=1 Tax=Elysia marginata TaxID=1093978 RepID=A0AAV4IRB0_9GAST|nr:lymphocyte antigen 75 [Elysia marginata]